MKNRILVIGQGFLGSCLKHALINQGFDTFCTKQNHVQENLRVDIRKINEIKKCISTIKPNAVINCAAVTDLDYLEKNSDIAFAVNTEGAKNVALICNEEKVRLIHISTDGVFDGKIGSYDENDVPHPINIYGQSKLQGENFVKNCLENFMILRTNFFGYNEERKNLFTWIYTMLKQQKEFTGFSDVFFNPLEISNLCHIIIEILTIKENGILHLTSDAQISKYDFARKVANTFEFDKNLIKKGSINDADFIAKRSLNTSLSNNKAKSLLKSQIISIDDSLISIRESLFK